MEKSTSAALNGFWGVFLNEHVNPEEKGMDSKYKKRYGDIEPIYNPNTAAPAVDQDPSIYIRWGQEPGKGFELDSIENAPHPHRHNHTYEITDYAKKIPFYNYETKKLEPRNRCHRCHIKYKNNGADCCGMNLTGWVKIKGINRLSWAEINNLSSCYREEEHELYKKIISQKLKNIENNYMNKKKDLFN